MGNVVAIEEEKPAKKAPARKSSIYAEDPRAQFLLVGTNELEKREFYFQVNITGLRRRVFGPYCKRSTAIESFDVLLGEVRQAFCDVENGEGLDRAVDRGQEHVPLPLDLRVCP